MTWHYVKIVAYGTEETVKILGPYDSERQAEKAEHGLSYNLDHSKFYTEVYSE